MNISDIYELEYSPLTTPEAILDNIYLENYESINYSKNGEHLVCEIKCRCVDDNALTVFYYHFDQKRFLQKVTMKHELGEEEVFNRTKELTKARREYKKQKKTRLAVG